MSDPVTNAQIEDVLSSIRRLVSDDNRSAGAAAQPESTREGTATPPPKANRLVLTPALRVSDSGVARPDDGTEATGSGPAPWASPGTTLFDALGGARSGGEVPNEGAGVENAGVEEDASWEEVAPSVPADQPEDRDLSPQDDSLPDTSDDAEPDAADGGETMPGQDDDPLDADEEVGAPETPPAFHSTRAENLSAKIEALEAVIGRTRDQWEPDGTSDDAYAGTPVEGIGWQDLDEENPEDSDDAPDDLAADEAVIDEDSLRELVAEIVRQELQGALGERITRNVRKLVRREIHRVLASQDLD